MFRDEYTNFSFNELESENFKVWITNKEDLKRNMSPNFSDKFNTPTGGQIRYHEGTTIDKQDFKLSCAAINVTLNEWRAITEWLSPLKSGKLRFEWNDKYYYMVKVSKAPSGTMFMKGAIDNIMGQLYIITFDLEFTTVHDWAALGNYAEQNSINSINTSIYNNEYYIPSVIMRDKYIYRTDLTSQTIYPSAEIVVVSSGDTYDFTALTADTPGIASITFGKIPLPTHIVFDHGYAPFIQNWDFNANTYGEATAICSDDIFDIQNIILEVKNNDYTIGYTANYDSDKNIELTLYTEGIIDTYENKFILLRLLTSEDSNYQYPITALEINDYPPVIYAGGVYTIKANVINSKKNIQWSVAEGSEDITITHQGTSCTFSVPLDWDVNNPINIIATLEDPEGVITQEVFKGGIYVTPPSITISASSYVAGVDEVIQLNASLYGLSNVNFEWNILEGADNIEIADPNNISTTATLLTSGANITLQASGRSAVSTGENDIISKPITIQVKESTVEITTLSPDESLATILPLDSEYECLLDVIGEVDRGYIEWDIEVDQSIQELIELNTVSLDNGDYVLTIYTPNTLTDANNESLSSVNATLKVSRIFNDGRDDQIATHSFTIYKGIQITGVSNTYAVPLNSAGKFPVTDLDDIENCINYNYFASEVDITKTKLVSSDESVLEILDYTNDNILKLRLNSEGEATLTCEIYDETGNVLDTDSIDIKVHSKAVVTWADTDYITKYKRSGDFAEELPYNFFEFEVDEIIAQIIASNPNCSIRIVKNADYTYTIAYFQESYSNDELVVKVDLEGSGFQLHPNSVINSPLDILTREVAYDISIRVQTTSDGTQKTYYEPISDWNNTVTVITPLDLISYYYKKTTIDWTEEPPISYIKGWEDLKGNESLSLVTTTFDFSGIEDTSNHKLKIFYPKELGSSYGYITITAEDSTSYNKIVEFAPYNDGANDYDFCILSDFNDIVKGTVEAHYYIKSKCIIDGLGDQITYFYLDEPSNFTDYLTRCYATIRFSSNAADDGYGLLNEEDNVVNRIEPSGTGLLIINSGDYIEVSLPQDPENSTYTSIEDFSVYKLKSSDKPRHSIDSIYQSTATPMMFSLRRTMSRKTNIYNYFDGGIPQLGILSMDNSIVGYVYNDKSNEKTYYRHYFENDGGYWDECIGTPMYYEFKSHPTYSLINHNYQDSDTSNFNNTLKLLLKAPSNTVLCNTGVFNMYPTFFVKGGCKIYDSLQEYYSFLTATDLKGLFVTVNSRTSTMLHNGTAIDSSYNILGMPLFRDIKNENQLTISSGKPELLKVIFTSEEECEYSGTYQDYRTGRKVATFKINNRPMYGRRNKFVVHIFNSDFYSALLNIHNVDQYDSKEYLNQLNNGKHLILDSPYISYNETENGWEMTINYRAYDSGDSKNRYYDFKRNIGDQYSNVSTITEMLSDGQNILYISLCDYQDLDILTEGEDYSVGTQARGVI